MFLVEELRVTVSGTVSEFMSVSLKVGMSIKENWQD